MQALYYKAPFFYVEILEKEDKLFRISFVFQKRYLERKTPLLEALFQEIQEYFLGKREEFSSFPLYPWGTPKEREIYFLLQKIPYGEVCSYKEIASRWGNPYASRFVANTCKKNPFPLLIPCHRVVGSHSLGGFTPSISIKKYLLYLEVRKKNRYPTSHSILSRKMGSTSK